MKALVLSQVSLSFALPAAIIPMLIITSKKNIMGSFVNKSWVKYLGILITTIIVALNSILIFLTITGKV
jgi:manganese transport protein